MSEDTEGPAATEDPGAGELGEDEREAAGPADDETASESEGGEA